MDMDRLGDFRTMGGCVTAGDCEGKSAGKNWRGIKNVWRGAREHKKYKSQTKPKVIVGQEKVLEVFIMFANLGHKINQKI